MTVSAEVKLLDQNTGQPDLRPVKLLKTGFGS